jgi:hypothetical protein
MTGSDFLVIHNDKALAAVAQGLIGDDSETEPPGACCAILSSGEDGKMELRMAVAGVRQRGACNPVEEGDVWHMGSCSKAMTATLVAVLIDNDHFPRYGATVSQITRAAAAAAGEITPCTFHASYAEVDDGYGARLHLLYHTRTYNPRDSSP